MRKRLGRKFFIRPTLRVAQDFLGKCLVRKIGKRVLVGKIVEVEAYIGPEDRASHAFGGKVTQRNRAEYFLGGHVYIYLVYGIYFQLNISTSKEGYPACVLIRALEPAFAKASTVVKTLADKSAGKPEKVNIHLANGPGKLCRWLRLNKSFYGEDVTKSKKLWVEDRGVKKKDIGVSPRIGIDYAGPVWAKKPWRFYLKGNPFVSR